MSRVTPSLAEVQAWMQAVLIHPFAEGSAPARAHLPATLTGDPVAAVIRAGRLGPREHLAVYQHSYLARLQECMAAQFPALRHALGPALFGHFVDQYLQAYPSRSPTLANLGKRLPEHLAATRPDTDETWPQFLIELARFEVAISELFDAEEPAADGLLLPVRALFEHSFPVGRYYLAATRGEAPALPLSAPSWTLVVRRDLRLAVLDLLPEQYALLHLLMQGMQIDAALDSVAAQWQVTPLQVRAVWPVWRTYLAVAFRD